MSEGQSGDWADPSHPDYPEYLNDEGIRFWEKYETSMDASDLENSIIVTRMAVELTKGKEEWILDRAMYLNNLAVGLYARFKLSKNSTDLEDSIKVGRNAIELTQNRPEADDSELAMFLGNLAIRYYSRYLTSAEVADLEEAISLMLQAIEHTSEDSKDRSTYLRELGRYYGHSFPRTGKLPRIYEAIRLTKDALQLAQQSQHLHSQVDCLCDLGLQFSYKHKRTGAIADVEDAISYFQKAVELATESDAPGINKPLLLNNLGLGYSMRYRATDDSLDVNKAIELSREAVATARQGNGDRVRWSNNLASALSDRYYRTGAIADLEESIEIAWEVVNAEARNSIDRGMYMNNLTNRLLERYKTLGTVRDLNEAVRVDRESLKSFPTHDPHRTRALCALSGSLETRYELTQDTKDLDEVIGLVLEAIALTPEDHVERAELWGRLGHSLGSKAKRTGENSIRDEAIRVLRLAIEATPEHDPDKRIRMNNLSVELLLRSLAHHDMTNFDEAVQSSRDALSLVPEGHPERAVSLGLRAECLEMRYVGGKDLADIREATSLYQTALEQHNADVSDRMKAGRALLHCCTRLSDWHGAYEAARTTIELISRLTLRSLEASDKQHRLREIAGFASDAAAVALNANKGVWEALNLLEKGRGVIAGSLEDLRTDVISLHQEHPDLAEQFLECQRELQALAANGLSAAQRSTWQNESTRRYNVGKKLDELINEIRRIPHFSDFLLAPEVEELQRAAEFGPIVVTNVSEYRCDALLIERHNIRLLNLSTLSKADIIARVAENELGSLGTLEWLWDTLVSPILTALGFSNPPPTDEWPHIWWVPTGPLSKFPIHAAGCYRDSSKKSETVLDRAVSSYSSTVKALIHGRRRFSKLPAQAKSLLVAMQDTPGHSQLRFAADEIALVRKICETMNVCPIEPGRRKQDVISCLSDCQIFHFAGHGHSDLADPSRSFLLLQDWEKDPLSVGNLLDLNLSQQSPFLAFLSACGTGQIRDEKFYDESIHLINAFQLAGFRHVIGTLWEVDDRLCAEMARMVYQGIRDRGLTDVSVSRSLHEAARELRSCWMIDNGIIQLGMTDRSKRFAKQTKANTRSAHSDDKTGGWSIRDVVSCDEDEGTKPLWIPYVHFGC